MKPEDLSNKDEPILYIVLNTDANLTPGEKYAAVSHLTSMFVDAFYINKMNINQSNLFAEWISSYGQYGNTVVLEASEKDIYANCFEKYDNVVFDKLISDTKRMAHHNWNLSKPKHVGLYFFGIKSEMPKWIRQLELAK